MKSIIGALANIMLANSFSIGPAILISFYVESPIDSFSDDMLSAKITGSRNRIGLKRIIKISEIYDVPFTFFSTGHALLKECKGHKLKVKIVRKNKKYDFHIGEYIWHSIDPASNYIEYPEFYYGDLIDEIVELGMKHEVASHSFSHIPYALVEDEVVSKDLSMSVEAINSHNLELCSFAFPFNLADKFYLLPRFGINVCRIDHRTIHNISRRDNVLVVKTNITDLGIASLYLWFKIINLLAKRKSLLSWYLHPITLYDERTFKLFEEIIKYLKYKRVHFLTFKDLYHAFVEKAIK
jgi:peptidoglycan/xylan/chitin deacetylase (PgdA/CDA1 family)